MKKTALLLTTILLMSLNCGANDAKKPDPGDLAPIKLLSPKTSGGEPLMDSLRNRKSSRSFTADRLPLQLLSNLLWAAFGINRPEKGYRTAPSALNRQEIDVYVAMQEGVYLFDAKSNMLNPVAKGDFREKTTELIQPSRKSITGAPVQLIYVANSSRTGIIGSDADKLIYASISAGCIVQNVYLFCASFKLGTVVRALFDEDELSKIIGLKKNDRIIITQTVGYIK
jgi:SagB-type dehydrogenase family enzyme